MSARSRYLLERDIARESTDIGKKAAEAGDYLAREKTSSQIGGSLGAYAGVQLAGLIAGGPITWGAAAVAAGLGYLVGGKTGEEISERKDRGWNKGWVIGEDKYSDKGGEFHRDLKGGKFLKEDRKLTSESLMEAKKGTDLWGGIGKGALMASATAGIKYGAVDDIKTKIKAGKFSWMLPERKEPVFGAGNLKDAGKITKKGAEYENMLDKIEKAKPDEKTLRGIKNLKGELRPEVAPLEKVLAGANPRASLTMPDETLADKVGLAEGRDEVISGMKLGGGYASGTKHPPMVGGVLQTPREQIADAVSSGLNEGAEEFVTRTHVHSKGGLYKAVDEGATTQINPFGITPEMEKGLTTRGQELTGKNLAQVVAESDVPALDQGAKFHEKNLSVPDTKYETGRKTVDLRGNYLSDMGVERTPTKAFENLEAGFAGDIPEELAYSPKELENIKSYGKSEIDWDKISAEQQKNILAEKSRLDKRMTNVNETSAFGMEDFTEQSYEKTINEIDYKKTMGQDFAKSQKLEGVKDISVKPASVADAHQQAIAQFYDPALTATESWGNTANIKAFKESPIFSSLPGKTASNKYYNWHKMVSKAYKANQ